MKQRNTILRACAVGAITFGLAIIALWSTGKFPPVALANSGGGVTYRTLTKCTPTGGAILNSPTGTTFVNNTVVTLTADPDPGLVFTGWSGAVSGTTNPVNLTMNANKSVCATFKPELRLHGVGLVSEGTNGSFWVILSAPSSSTVTVQYNVTGGTATGGGVDYTFQAGTLTFEPNEQEQWFSFPIMEDALDEPLETITLSLSNPVNAVLSALSTATCMIGEPPPPGVAFESDSSTVGESAGTAILPLDLFGFYGGSFGVSYRYSGTAVSDVDYDASSTVYSINDMQYVNDAAIEIPIVDDELDEGDETVIVTLRQSSGFLSVPATHTLTIVDDDDEPLVASFEAEPRVGTAPLEVDFTDTSASGLGAITGWQWDFGDGTGSTAQHPTHTYAEPGAYTVSLTVETGDGEDTEVRAGYIQVGGEGASIGVFPSVIQFGYVALGQSKVVSVTIQNDGDETLTGTAAVEAPFSIDGDAEYAIPPEGETFLNVIYTPTAAVASYDVIGLPGGGNAQVAVHGSAIAPEPEAAAGVRLNELVVWNTSGVVSANGEYVDWIELYNDNDYALDISGWTLTDDDLDTDMYMLPAGTIIGPKSYLLVYASTETASLPGELHTGFVLDEVNGGYLGLFAPNGATATSEVNYPAATEPDRSYSFLDESNKDLAPFGPAIPTPFSLNRPNKVWSLDVYVSPSLSSEVLQLIPDPSRNFTQYTGGIDDFVTIYEWLPIVANYVKLVLQDDTGAHIVSPIHPNQLEVSMDVPADVSVAAEVQFNLIPITQLVNVVDNMPGTLTSPEAILRTVKSAPDGSMVVCEEIKFTEQGEEHFVPGVTFRSTSKKVMIMAALTLEADSRHKWHSKTFAHELGHYAGIFGHFVGSNPPENPPLDDTSLMRGDDMFPTGPNSEDWHEPWFLVNVTAVARRFYEGETWGSPEQRSKNPDYLLNDGFYISNFDSDMLGAAETQLSDPAIQPW